MPPLLISTRAMLEHTSLSFGEDDARYFQQRGLDVFFCLAKLQRLTRKIGGVERGCDGNEYSADNDSSPRKRLVTGASSVHHKANVHL